MSLRPERRVRRIIVACTAMSLLGVLSALLDYGLSHNLLWSPRKTGLPQETARLASALLASMQPAAPHRHAIGHKPAEDGDVEPPHFLTASMTPVSLSLVAEPEPAQDVNRGIKTDRIFTEVAVPKLIIPEPEPITEGASAALFLLSPGIPAPAPPPAAASTIASGPTTRAPFAVTSPAKNLFVSSAAAAAKGPAPAKYGWSELVRMASMKGGDGEEPAKIFGALSEKEFRARELRCMATAIYFEARGETVRGQIAVAQVIMTRVRSDFYPNTICGVVFQGQWNRNACQFSFACDGHTDAPKETEQWATALDVAKRVISGKAWLSEIAEATHYHATYVRPDWARQIRRITRIGIHIFYKAPYVQPVAANPDYQSAL